MLKRENRKKDNPLRKTLTPREAAKELGFGVNATYRLLDEGVIPSIRIGNRFYIPKAALLNWLASCGGGKVA